MTHKKNKAGQQGASQKPITGIAWYFPNQWKQLRDAVSDPERLEETYEEWLAIAEKAFANMAASGVPLIKVPVDVQDLVGWCQARNIPIDAKARAEYVVDVLRRRSTT